MKKRTLIIFFAIAIVAHYAHSMDSTQTTLKKKGSFTPEVDLSQLSYEEKYFDTKINQQALTIKLDYEYKFLDSSSWSIGAESFLTTTVASKSRNEKVHLVGAEAHLGSDLFSINSYQLTVTGGGTYRTMPSFQDLQFGYKDIFGPTIYPTISKLFTNGKSATLTAKYIPLYYRSDFKPGFTHFGNEAVISISYGKTTKFHTEWMSQRLDNESNSAKLNVVSLGISREI